MCPSECTQVTALIESIVLGDGGPAHVATLKALVDAGADVNIADRNGDSPLALARRAQELQPAEPLFNDTLGWILVKADQTDEGLRFLREARTRAALVPEIRYHLAVALQRQGRTDEALAELRNALRAAGDFDGRADAERLHEELGG